MFANISGIASGKTLPIARQKCIAKGVLMSKETVLERDHRFSDAFFSGIDLGNVGTREG